MRSFVITLKCSCLLYSFEGTPQQRNPVAIAEWIHLFPYRTQSLSTHTSKVLGWRRPGRIESCWLMTHPKGCVFYVCVDFSMLEPVRRLSPETDAPGGEKGLAAPPLLQHQGSAASPLSSGASDIFWSMMFVSSTLMWWSSAYQRMLSCGLRT